MPGSDLSERLLDFAAQVVRLFPPLAKTGAGRHISAQLTRSATSAGANYEEACGAESRADFIHKMQIVLKELRESHYWLRLIERCGIAKAISEPLAVALAEADELRKIIGKSIVTARKNSR